jgi:hypothetical protein
VMRVDHRGKADRRPLRRAIQLSERMSGCFPLLPNAARKDTTTVRCKMQRSSCEAAREIIATITKNQGWACRVYCRHQ